MFYIDFERPSKMLPVLIMIARGGASAMFCSVYSLHPKMFPTLFSVTSIGICNFVCRTGLIFAPIIAEIAYPTPMIVFTVLSMIALICSQFIVQDDAAITQEKDERKHS